MRERLRERNNVTVFLCITIIFTIITVGIFIGFLYENHKYYFALIEKQLNDTTDFVADSIENKINTLTNESKLIADNINSEKSDLKSALKRILSTSSFENIIYYNNGKTQSADKSAQATSEIFIINNWIWNNKYKITESTNVNMDELNKVAIFVPIKNSGDNVKGIFTIYSYNTLLSEFKKLQAKYDFDTYLINNNIEYLAADKGNKSLYEVSKNIYDVSENARDKKTKEKLSLEQLINSKSNGSFLTTINNNDYYAFFSRVDSTPYCALTIASQKVLNNKALSVYSNFFRITCLFFGCYLILLIILVYNIFRLRKSVKVSKNVFERNNKKYQTAINHINGIIFEYNVEKDTLSFVSANLQKNFSFPRVIKGITYKGVQCGLISEKYEQQFSDLFVQAYTPDETTSIVVQGGKAFPHKTWLKITLTPFADSSGSIVEGIGTIEDVTASKQAEISFAQEEQYRKAMLTEAISVWSANLTEGIVSSYSVDGKNIFNNTLYTDELIDSVCEVVHKKYRSFIQSVFRRENLFKMYESGKSKERLEYTIKRQDDLDYIWVTTTINLITNPSSGDLMLYVYTKSIDKTKQYQIELEFKSTHDLLTNAYNRMALKNILNDKYLYDSSGDITSAFMMIDIDDFKKINDRFGHTVGDILLKEVVKLMKTCLSDNELIGRMGGDEFACFIPDITSKADVLELSDYLRDTVANHEFNSLDGEKVSLSIGISYFPEDGDNFQELYENADRALYVAKELGKNRTVEYR